jgi:WD40-like Beta Propeller Repeat
MNRPSSLEDRLDAWLEEGPSTGPVDLLATAHARARTVRQRPGWWLALKGDTMDTTRRARSLAPGGLGLLFLILALAIVIAAAGLAFGTQLLHDRGPNAVTLPIASGPSQLLAFTSWTAGGSNRGDLYVVRADGTDGRHLTSDALDDWSPAWSPEGSRIAFYSGDADSVQLRVISAHGVRVLADSPGCWNPTGEPPAWSPDGRFVVYTADRDPTDDVCDSLFNDLYVVPADGSAPARRLLAGTHTGYSTSPDWSPQGIAFAGNELGSGGLWVAAVIDPSAPWDLVPLRIEHTNSDPVGYLWTRWSPDGTQLATTYTGKNAPFSNAVVMSADGATTRSLWADPTTDSNGPYWSPDGSRLSVLIATTVLPDYGKYEVAVVDAEGQGQRVLQTPPLSMNGGPVMFSPDGTRLAARANRDEPMPGDVLILTVDADPSDPESTIRVPAGQWSSLSWQPVANPENPVVGAPEGLPSL